MCISAIALHQGEGRVEGDCRNAYTYVHFSNFLPPEGGHFMRMCTLSIFLHQRKGRVEGNCRNAHAYVRFCNSLPPYLAEFGPFPAAKKSSGRQEFAVSGKRQKGPPCGCQKHTRIREFGCENPSWRNTRCADLVFQSSNIM